MNNIGIKRIKAFIKRNLLEMLRDPLIYIFCLGFPIGMILMLNTINRFSSEDLATFKCQSLIPGILVFSCTFIMLIGSLQLSKDRCSSLLKRLYISPTKSYEYVIAYSVPLFIIGICQEIICVLSGLVLSSINGEAYFSFVQAVLLILINLPILLICISLGLLFGSLLNQNGAPGITSIFITGGGLLGGCWMPVETMGNFVNICKALPFYPSVYLGRMITGAKNMFGEAYTFENDGLLFVIVIAVYLVASLLLTLFVFKNQMKEK